MSIYLRPSYEAAIRQIIRKGGSHMKFELEANLGRNTDGDDYHTCYDCDGDGYEHCSNCDGTGVLLECETDHEHEDVRVCYQECTDCYGEGRFTCNNCDGEGSCCGGGSDWDDASCRMFILDYVANRHPHAREVLTFSLFYYDGSVDSEFTFTLPTEYAHYAVYYIEAFKALAEEIGELSIEGAGMHTSVLPEATYYGKESFDDDKLANFQREVSKLLPALYLLASPNSYSRSLYYRQPQIEFDEKYSAIYLHGGKAIEYRLFEPCYDKPEMVLEYIEVIAHTLRYYSKLKCGVKGQSFHMPENGDYVSRFYQTPVALRMLQAGLRYLAPAGKTPEQCMAERGCKLELHELTRAQRKAIARAAVAYRLYVEEQERSIERNLNYDIEMFRRCEASFPNDSHSYSWLRPMADKLEMAEAREEVVEFLKQHYKASWPTLEQYATDQTQGRGYRLQLIN